MAAGLLAVALWGFYAFSQQLRYGLGVTGLNRPVYWGFYITNFVFFIGISHAGTLISAILRLCRAEWRRPITRMAETITVLVLFFGLGSIIMDLGRPDRALFVIPFLQYGRVQSPLVWDVMSISMYLTASTIYLYMPLIPDIALLRDRVTGWRRGFYRALSLGWTGSPRQHRHLEIAIAIMAVLVIPIAVSVHTTSSPGPSSPGSPPSSSPWPSFGRSTTWRTTSSRCTSTTWGSSSWS
ncbi:MAG: polysulfide reductase NrfD [Deltaproteobacteria bacterium]|nr:polysulfide reductase NrfD [Deltaproteobacteria bacterium]